jgi:hypothetical protein
MWTRAHKLFDEIVMWTAECTLTGCEYWGLQVELPKPKKLKVVGKSDLKVSTDGLAYYIK